MGVTVMRPLTSGIFQRLVPHLAPQWRRSHDVNEVALKFVLSDSRVHVANVGMRWPEEVAKNVACVESFVPDVRRRRPAAGHGRGVRDRGPGEQPMTDSVAERRKQLLARLFPEGVPTLWCPLLTHYTADGAVDTARMAAHLAHLSRGVKGYLIPGTTGDGWELTPEETRTVTAFAVESARERELHLLIGILQREAPAAREEMEKTAAWLQEITGADSPLEAMRRARVSGFAVCPPAGEERPQDGIRDALAGLLSLELPLALYQLPQVTRNEMSPEVVAALAARFPNLILLKDSSGADRVALAGGDLPHVFLVRGAEGGFAGWLRAGGGPYDGFLLSTANCLAPELAEVLRLAQAGKREEAEAISAAPVLADRGHVHRGRGGAGRERLHECEQGDGPLLRLRLGGGGGSPAPTTLRRHAPRRGDPPHGRGAVATRRDAGAGLPGVETHRGRVRAWRCPWPR